MIQRKGDLKELKSIHYTKGLVSQHCGVIVNST